MLDWRSFLSRNRKLVVTIELVGFGSDSRDEAFRAERSIAFQVKDFVVADFTEDRSKSPGSVYCLADHR